MWGDPDTLTPDQAPQSPDLGGQSPVVNQGLSGNSPDSPDMGGDSPFTQFNQPQQKPQNPDHWLAGGHQGESTSFGHKLKDALQRFAYFGSQAAGASVGLETDAQAEKRKIDQQLRTRQLDIQQQNEQRLAQQGDLVLDQESGQMVQRRDLAQLMKARIAAMAKVQTTDSVNATKQAILDKTLNSQESRAEDANKLKSEALKWNNHWKGITAGQNADKLAMAHQKLADAVNAPTQNIKTQGQMADMLLQEVPNIERSITDLGKKGKLGPMAGRYSEFMAGKVGEGDPDYVALRTNLGLFQTALMKAHVGARGSEKIMEHFKNLIDSGKFSPEALHAAMGTVSGYLEIYKAGGQGKFGSPSSPKSDGGSSETRTYQGHTYTRTNPNAPWVRQ